MAKKDKNLPFLGVPMEEHLKWAAWARNVNMPAARKLFDELEEVFNRVTPLFDMNGDPGRNSTAHRSGVIAVLQKIRLEWFAIDRSRLSSEDSRSVYYPLIFGLPDLATFYRTSSVQHSVEGVVYGHVKPKESKVKDDLEEIYVSLLQVREKQWSETYRSGLAKQAMTFAGAEWRSHDIKAAMNAVQALWAKADAMKLSEDDREFVDEAAIRYLPESWNIFRAYSAAGTDPEVRTQALSLFMMQLDMMSVRLKQIMSSSRTVSLSDMRTQSSFLRDVSR